MSYSRARRGRRRAGVEHDHEHVARAALGARAADDRNTSASPHSDTQRLAAGHAAAVAVGLEARLDGGGVRAGVRLGQREAAEQPCPTSACGPSDACTPAEPKRPIAPRRRCASRARTRRPRRRARAPRTPACPRRTTVPGHRRPSARTGRAGRRGGRRGGVAGKPPLAPSRRPGATISSAWRRAASASGEPGGSAGMAGQSTLCTHAGGRPAGVARRRSRRRRCRRRDRRGPRDPAWRRHGRRQRRRPTAWRRASRACACSRTPTAASTRACWTRTAPALVISQFTLYGDTSRGNRPSFTAKPRARAGGAPLRARLRAPAGRGRARRGARALRAHMQVDWSTTGR